MSQGTFLAFDEFKEYIGDGTHDMDGDTFYVMLIDNTVVPTVSTATPDTSLFTEVATGNGYTTPGASLTTTWTSLSGTTSFKVTNGPITWSLNASGPTNVYYAIVYNFTHAGSLDAVGFIDMTEDGGTTPLSLQDADIVINFDANGVFTLS